MSRVEIHKQTPYLFNGFVQVSLYSLLKDQKHLVLKVSLKVTHKADGWPQ